MNRHKLKENLICNLIDTVPFPIWSIDAKFETDHSDTLIATFDNRKGEKYLALVDDDAVRYYKFNKKGGIS